MSNRFDLRVYHIHAAPVSPVGVSNMNGPNALCFLVSEERHASTYAEGNPLGTAPLTPRVTPSALLIFPLYYPFNFLYIYDLNLFAFDILVA